MTKILTENTYTDTLKMQGWDIQPLNFVTFVEPPAVMAIFKSVEPLQGIKPGEFELIQIDKNQNIDKSLHQLLLEESLMEYRDIWRTLAGK